MLWMMINLEGTEGLYICSSMAHSMISDLPNLRYGDVGVIEQIHWRRTSSFQPSRIMNSRFAAARHLHISWVDYTTKRSVQVSPKSRAIRFSLRSMTTSSNASSVSRSQPKCTGRMGMPAPGANKRIDLTRLYTRAPQNGGDGLSPTKCALHRENLEHASDTDGQVLHRSISNLIKVPHPRISANLRASFLQQKICICNAFYCHDIVAFIESKPGE